MTPFQQVLDIGYHMVLPVITLMMLSIGGLMRYTRTNMLEVLIQIIFGRQGQKGFRKMS